MQIKKWLVIALPLSMTLLTGCSLLEKLVYRIDINQGNYVKPKAVDKLKFGMTKEQVRFVLGSPMLIENGYPNAWYYIDHRGPKVTKIGAKESYRSPFNDEGKLVNIDGDFAPSSDFFEQIH